MCLNVKNYFFLFRFLLTNVLEADFFSSFEIISDFFVSFLSFLGKAFLFILSISFLLGFNLDKAKTILSIISGNLLISISISISIIDNIINGTDISLDAVVSGSSEAYTSSGEFITSIPSYDASSSIIPLPLKFLVSYSFE